MGGGASATGAETPAALIAERLRAQGAGGAGGDRGPVVAAFAQALLRRVPSAQLAARPDEIVAALADTFAFVDRRPPDDIRIRLIDPAIAFDGLRPQGSVLEVSCEDRQFITTTVREELHRLGRPAARILHPVFGSERASDGTLTAVVPAREARHRDAFLHVELAERVAPEDRVAAVEAIHAVLVDVFAVTGDFEAMCNEIAEVAAATRRFAPLGFAAEDAAEVADLLMWMVEGNFLLAGSCRYPASSAGATGALGILARPGSPLRAEDPPPGGPDVLLRIGRTGQVSRVHRQVPMHRVDVTEVDASGTVTGVFRLVGLLSHRADTEPAVLTPVLRAKLRRVLESEDVVAGSHDEEVLVSLFQGLPKEDLFEADVDSLRETLMDLLAAQREHGVWVRARADPAAGLVSVLLSLPQDLYSSNLRHRLERHLLATLEATGVDAHVSLGDGADAIVRLVVSGAAGGDTGGATAGERPLEYLERELALLCRTWVDQLRAEVVARVGEDPGRRLGDTWAEWFPSAYRDAVDATDAVDDVLQLALLTDAVPAPRFRIAFTPDRSGRTQARLKVFTTGAAVELSGFLPVLESLGLWVVDEQPYQLGPGRLAAGVQLHDFGVNDATGGELSPEEDGARLAEAAVALWVGQAEIDSLNRLVLRAGMSWKDVVVLRAYRRYRNQVGTTFTTGYVDDVLVEHASVARALVELFAARFDPRSPGGPELAEEWHARVAEGCDAVARLDHDRILRGFLDLVDATLRTNRYLDWEGDLALKLDSSAVPDAPSPVPHREIFVHGPTVEGIHLRWGPVARGGIRWSERVDDYRTEVLGLMRAQVLKNALIVPTGAKGGFVVKRPRPGGPSLSQGTGSEVARAYERFIISLLSVTDNVVTDGTASGRVVGVPRRRDGDDPYLVVAADRGTAGLSDLANRLAEDKGFWLGDAFASGGSRGYDHKGLGITARGAWVAIRHHFAALDIDLDAERVTVVGIGDLSGDVFGNGMLASDRLRLVAAFDHRDVFVDPDPDPVVSHRERSRLFGLPRSSWQDYDRTAISPGGGVWSRLDKRVDLSPQVRELLGIDREHLPPAELIRAILAAPVTLLFAGGIGTFVRASHEPDNEIDDRANAEVRVPASSIRARVVGEGANLAFTQRARIEYARRGGRINTDAIDNAGGVDLSDREVNLKVLLRPAVESGEITPAQRDTLLIEVCDDVVEAVLRDCSLQSAALSQAQAASPHTMDALEVLMVELESAGVLDRAVEALPTTEEMHARAQADAGLTRPELAVVLAGAKRRLVAHLLASAVPDQPALGEALVAYFPAHLRDRFRHLIGGHRLRRELVAMVMANEIVNRMGPTFVTRMVLETGAERSEVAAAFWIARGVSDAPGLWETLDAGVLSEWSPEQAAEVVTDLLVALTSDYLRRGEGGDIAATVARDRPVFDELEAVLADLGTVPRRRRRIQVAEALMDGGVDALTAVQWTCLAELEITPDVAELARATSRPVTGVAEVFLGTGESFGIDRLIERLSRVEAVDRWSRAARQGLRDDLDDLRREGARRALEEHLSGPEEEALGRFVAARAGAIEELGALVREIEREPAPRLDALAVAVRTVRQAILR